MVRFIFTKLFSKFMRNALLLNSNEGIPLCKVETIYSAANITHNCAKSTYPASLGALLVVLSV